MSHNYYIFGLNIKSDIPLPATPIENPSSTIIPDVLIEYGDTPEQLLHPISKNEFYEAAPGKFLMNIQSIGRYYVREGRRIIITPDLGANENRMLIFLMGSAMGALLHQRNYLVLHAGGIRVNRSAAIFIGPSKIGKSTLAACFHQRGYPFLADDVCAITMIKGKPHVIPGFPQLKLWDDILKKIGKDKNQLKSVICAQDLEKYFMPVIQENECPVPLKTIFSLETNQTNQIILNSLSGAAKIHSLIKNTYRLEFLQGLGGKREHFKHCAMVCAHVNVFQVERPQKGFLLDELMEKIEEALQDC